MPVIGHVTDGGAARNLTIPGKYLSLTTYRRDGSSVSTPVWFVEDPRGRDCISCDHCVVRN